MALRRAERIMGANEDSSNPLDVSHLFNGHHWDEGTKFVVGGLNDDLGFRKPFVDAGRRVALEARLLHLDLAAIVVGAFLGDRGKQEPG